MQELRPGRLGEVGVPPDCHARQGSGWESWVGAAVQQVRRNRCRSEQYLLRCGSGSQGEPETQPLPAK